MFTIFTLATQVIHFTFSRYLQKKMDLFLLFSHAFICYMRRKKNIKIKNKKETFSYEKDIFIYQPE